MLVPLIQTPLAAGELCDWVRVHVSHMYIKFHGNPSTIEYLAIYFLFI